MEITGKIIFDLPEQSGQSKTGNPWRKKEYVLETEDTYPRKVHFDFFGERADQYPLSVGDDITLSFDIESREYQAAGTRASVAGKLKKQEPPSLLLRISQFLRFPT